MKRESNKLLTASVVKLMHRGATSQLRKIIGRTHPADLAYTFSSLAPEHRRGFFDLLEETDLQKAAAVLSELESGVLVRVLDELEDKRLVELLEVMA
ncbi:MAG: magnesium transporter MgtE N-terminal domain-containing protein, partial [Persicimonas sp.]